MPWPFSRKKPPPPSDAPLDDLVDLHCHALPGVDDGAADLEEAHAILDGLAALGYRRVALTPHYNHPMFENAAPSLLDERVEDLRRAREDRAPALILGAEVMVDERFLDEVRAGDLPTVGAPRTHLIEFAYGRGTVPSGFEELVFRLQVKDVALIVAHAERYPDFQRDTARLEALARGGALVQVNLMSLAGRYGHPSRRAAWEFIERGIADLAASDLHHAADLPNLARALEDLARTNRAEAKRLVSDNPRLVLEGKPFEVSRRE
jgi:protein-tyrosine phosphatase